MSIYARHVLKGFLGLFLLCFLSATAVFVIIDFVGNSRLWITRPPGERYVYYLNYLPYIAYLISPVAALLAAVFSVGKLAKHFELVAMRAAGVSVTRILSPVLIAGAVLSAVMFVLQDTILPDANNRRFQIQEPGPGVFDGRDPRERLQYLYTGTDGTLLYFQHYNGHQRVGSLVTALRLRNGAPALRVDAARLHWIDSAWTFRNGVRREFRDDSVFAEPFDEWMLPGFRDPPGELLDTRRFPDEMSMAELSRRVGVLERTGEPSHALRTHWHFRIASALVNLLMVILGAMLAVNAVRTGLARNFGIGLFLTFLYYIALRMGLVMGENGGMHPMAAAWFGNIIFFPVAILLWWKAARA